MCEEAQMYQNGLRSPTSFKVNLRSRKMNLSSISVDQTLEGRVAHTITYSMNLMYSDTWYIAVSTIRQNTQYTYRSKLSEYTHINNSKIPSSVSQENLLGDHKDIEHVRLL